MQKRSLKDPWRVALAVVALTATVMALYVQLFERKSRRAEDQLAATRLEAALAESGTRLKTEILAQLRAELARQDPAGRQGDQPLPDTVLRRGDAGGGRALQQESQGSQAAARIRFQERLDALARQADQSDRALRRDLEEVRSESRREQEVSSQVLSLLLAALVPLVLDLLASLRPLREETTTDGAP